MQINFHCSKEDHDLISKIVDRALPMFSKHTPKVERGILVMDITACHANDCRLDLVGLLAADNFNFVHDVAGIYRHMDRDTGKLRDCFLPRYNAKQQGV